MNIKKDFTVIILKRLCVVFFLCLFGFAMAKIADAAMESHLTTGYDVGRLKAFNDVVEHAGGFHEAAANEDAMSLLYSMRGGSGITYLWLESLYRLQETDSKNINWKNPENIKLFDPSKIDLLVIDSAENLSDIELHFYLKNKLDRIGKKHVKISTESIKKETFYYELDLKTNFGPYEIDLLSQCLSRLEDRYGNEWINVFKKNQSGGCNDIFYTLTRSYDKRHQPKKR